MEPRRVELRKDLAISVRLGGPLVALRVLVYETGVEIGQILRRWSVPRFDPKAAHRSAVRRNVTARMRMESGAAAFDPKPAHVGKTRADYSESMRAWPRAEVQRILQHRLNVGATVIVREKGYNRKLSPVVWQDVAEGRKRPKALRPFVALTYAAIEPTCPSSCKFKTDADGPHGCFVDAGFPTKKLSAQLNAAALGLTPEQVIAEEAWAIDRLFGGGPVPQDGARGGRDLRIHVGGDVASEAGARMLAGAAARYVRRGGGAVWTFTHHWREVPRSAFGCISVLASCESLQDVLEARARGYAVAIVVDTFPGGTRKAFDPASLFEPSSEAAKLEGLRMLPCPAETRTDTTCADCRLCLDRDLAKLGLGIAFSVHGGQAQRAREQLVQIRTPGAQRPAKPARRPHRCRRCHELGHNRATCGKARAAEPVIAGTYHCRGCGGLGHNRRSCKRRTGSTIVEQGVVAQAAR